MKSVSMLLVRELAQRSTKGLLLNAFAQTLILIIHTTTRAQTQHIWPHHRPGDVFLGPSPATDIVLAIPVAGKDQHIAHRHGVSINDILGVLQEVPGGIVERG